MEILHVKQGSIEWLKAREGFITSTKDLSPKEKGKGRRADFYKVLQELICKKHDLKPMDWGTKCEPVAREVYSKKTNTIVLETGLCIHKKYNYIRSSLDGLILDEKTGLYKKGIEIKCPSTETFLCWAVETLLMITEENGKKVYYFREPNMGIYDIPKDYIKQVLNHFEVVEDMETLDFVIYDPSVEKNNMFIITINRKDIEFLIADKLYQDVESYQELIEISKLFIDF